MTYPFAVRRTGDGIVWIDRKVDEAFKRALMAGVPPNLRAKMHAALTDVPGRNAMEFSVKYFGPELADIKNTITPLLIELNKLFEHLLRLPGFFVWLDATNLGNSYLLIGVFKEWAEMKHG